MMSLLGGEVAALLPGMTGATPAGTALSTTPQPFTDVLNAALDSLAAPDAASLALLSLQMPTPAPNAAPLPVSIVPSLLLSASVLPGSPTETTTSAKPAGGNSLPLGGNDIPPIGLAEYQNALAFQNPNLRYEPVRIDGTGHQNLLNETAASLPPLTLASVAPDAGATGAEQNIDLEQTLPKLDSFGTDTGVSNGANHRDRGNEESAAHARQKSAVMDSLSALSSVLAPFNPNESGTKTELSSVAMLSAAVRGAEPVAVIPDSAVPVAGGVTAPLASSAAPKAEFSIPQSPQQPGWGDAFGERVTFMVKQNLHEAEIRLNPPQLGQIDVRISLANDQASLIFSSPHAAVRDAIETSMVRLRELLGESGINLANVDVSDKSLAQQQKGADTERDSGRSPSWHGYRADFALDENAAALLGATANGRIDYYV